MHFLTFILTESGSEEEIEMVMEPFDENLEVDPYQTECWCRGGEALRATTSNPPPELRALDADLEEGRNRMRDLAQRLHGSGEESEGSQELREALEEVRTATSAIQKERTAVLQGLLQAHPLFDKPEPSCEECAGKGFHETTFNPEGRWDWYVLGGRWDGFLTDNCQPAKTVHDLIESRAIDTPYAVVGPDGWMDLEKVSSSQGSDDGREELLRILSAWEGLTVSVVDIHS